MNSSKYQHLKQVDHQHLWHPFTQHRDWFEQDPLIVERAEAFELYDVEGKSYLDGISSLWCNVHGHSVPELLEVMHEQIDTLCHSTLLGSSHVPAIELAEKLSSILPEKLSRVFYSDSGSAAVEAAIRMVLEWWQKKNTPAAKKKHRLLSLQNAYHGDTLGSVGLGYLEAFHQPLRRNIVPSITIPPPHIFRFFENCTEAEALEKSLEIASSVLEAEGENIAALVIEPLVQGAAGIWPHPAEYLRELILRCQKRDILVIADEVATGFGKTGSMFAVEQAEVSPDILVMGKGLSAGYLPISAAVSSEEVFEGFLGEPEELKTFFFGQTFSGNPLAARVSLRNLELFDSLALVEQVKQRSKAFQASLTAEIDSIKHVDEVRSCGLMTAIELTSAPGKRKSYSSQERVGQQIAEVARSKGVLIRPLGNAMILMPALRMDEPRLKRLVEVTAESIREVTEK